MSSSNEYKSIWILVYFKVIWHKKVFRFFLYLNNITRLCFESNKDKRRTCSENFFKNVWALLKNFKYCVCDKKLTNIRHLCYYVKHSKEKSPFYPNISLNYQIKYSTLMFFLHNLAREKNIQTLRVEKI